MGEVAGGGDSHGLLANEVCILEDYDTGEVVVEAHLEHSKTGFARYLDMAGKTTGSGIEVAQIYADYFKLAGIDTTTTWHQGIKVTRPDFWVVRVSLLGKSLDELEKLWRELRVSGVCASARHHARESEMKGRSRAVAIGKSSQEKKYINVAGGRGADVGMGQLVTALTVLGFHATVVKGPLLLASTGGRAPRVTLMPLSTSTTFAPMKEILTAAYEAANSDPADRDPDLDLQVGQAPKWSTHSLRRLADTVARRDRETNGTTEAEIDIYFGWHERILLREMQVHYAALNVKERMKQAKITGSM